MITQMRTVNIRHGKQNEAFAWAVEIAKYQNERFGRDITVMRNVAGLVMQVHWVSTFNSLAHFEEQSAQVWTDEEFLKRIAAVEDGDLFHSESFTDSLYATVP